MSIDTSAELCGKCHSETHFEWQISKHREAEVDCAACHDPHATALKNNDPGLLCASCHRQRASNFAHSAHSSEGLTCKDCHLQPLDQDPGSGHARQDHSFFVSLNTCNACHEYQMHDPVEVHPEPKAEVTVDAMSSVESNEVTEEPLPVSPVGYTTLSGLVGIAAGVILAPWIERLNRRRKDEKES